jgi:predicted permease
MLRERLAGLVETVLEIVVFIYLGAVLKRLRILNESIGRKLLSLSLNILLPLIVFRSFATVKISMGEFLLPMIGLLINLSLLTVAYLVSRIIEMNNARKGAFLLVCSTLNIGIIGLPFIGLFFNAEGVATASLIDIGNSIYVFAIAFLVASHFNPSKSKRSLKSSVKNLLTQPYILSIIAGLAANLLRLDLPPQAGELIIFVSLFNAIIVLLAAGVFIRFPGRSLMREVFLSAFVKILIGNLIGFAFAILLQPAPQALRVMIIVASLPPAFMTLVHASAENLDLEFASILLGSILAIGIPVIVFYGLFFSL